ncbi:unnamed protein product, partial [Discosporangium mesarthrocarpum]
MYRPSNRHMSAAKRTLHYIQGTRHTSLTYQRGHFKLRGYADAAYATEEDTSHSMSGYIFFLGNATLSWSSHTQSLVTRSSTECEFVSLIEATDEARYLSTFLQEIGHDATPVPIMADNKGTVDLAQ